MARDTITVEFHDGENDQDLWRFEVDVTAITETYGEDADGRRGELLTEYQTEILSANCNGKTINVTEIPQYIRERAEDDAITIFQGDWGRY